MDQMMPPMGGGGAPGQSPDAQPPYQPAMDLDPTHAQQPQMQQEPPEEQDEDDDGPSEDLIDYALSEANLAKKFKNKKDKDGDNVLDKMGQELIQAIEDDIRSRQGWMDQNEEWLKMALLIRENKTFPWPKASNVKYPLIATAAMQFSARAYPALVPNDGQIVKAKTSAVDLQGNLEKAAIRVAKHMSYQVLCEMPNWEEEMDKLLMTMAVSGICFKKTYHDSVLNKHVSCLVYPENLVINYYTKSLDKAYRKTELLHYTNNELKEKVENDEIFLDIDYDEPTNDSQLEQKKPIASDTYPSKVDKATPHLFYACHTYWDLDGDGYEEPYIITIHRNSKKVVRIIARWDSDGVVKHEKKIVKITPVEYFTDFPFIPNPDGSIYACGFGMLLGPLNESVNTLINQLIDAGTLSTLSSGFIGKNLRIKMGQLQIRPGEWKVVNATGEDLSKSFYPLPTKEPSEVLYTLLNLLIQSGNQLASIAEIFVGKMPGQNTPATTTQETIQQGMAVFTAIYKRVYRSLHKEFKKIFRLNRITPGIVKEEMMIAGEPLQQSDYTDDTEHLIIPGADPSGDSATVRLMKLQQVGQLMSLQTINPMVYTQRVLEANEIPNAQELLMQPQPQQDPKAQALQMKAQIDQQKAQTDMQAKQQELQIKQQLAELEAKMKQMELQYKQQELALELQGQQQQHHLDMVQGTAEMQHKQQMAAVEQQVAAKKAESDIATNEAMNEQALTHSEQAHEQKMKQTKEQAKVKPKGKNGGKQK